MNAPLGAAEVRGEAAVHCGVCGKDYYITRAAAEHYRGRCKSCAALARPRPRALTSRHIDVIHLAANGYGIKETARVLGATPVAIKNARLALSKILGVSGMAHAVAVAIRRGLIA